MDKGQFAVLLVRIILGIVLFIQGYDKLFRIKVRNVVDAYEFNTPQTKLTERTVYVATFYTSLVEFLGGLMLIIGLFTEYVTYFIAIDFIIVTIGLSYREAMWDMKNVFPRLAMLVFLMAAPASWNSISLDQLLLK